MLNDLDREAQPVYGDVWLPVDRAYWESGAPTIGPTRRFVFDEIFDVANNKNVNTFLKGVMAKRRMFKLNIAGSLPLTALNVHLCAAGNASPTDQFQQAVISRFHGAYALPWPVKSQEIDRAKSIVRAAKAAASSKKPRSVAPPPDFALTSMSFEPPPRKVGDPSNACYEKVYDFAKHTRDQFKARKYAQPLDPRGVLSVMTMIAHMIGGGMNEKAAFTASLKTVVAKIIKPSPSDGLPIEADQADLLKEVANLASSL